MKRKTTMKTTNYTVMAAITIGCFGCGSWLPKVDASRSIDKSEAFFGPRYTQDGVGVNPGDMADKLELEPNAAPHVGRARALRVVSTLLAAAGGALVGWPVGTWAGGQLLSNDSKPNWKLAAVGAGAIVVAIPLAIWSDSSMDKGVEAHNERVFAERVSRASNSRAASNRVWKPGERAGAPSTPRDAFGFVFGTSKPHAAAACQKAGHQWSDAEGVFRCSGTPTTAISAASAELEFGEGGLSSVEIEIAPPNDAGGWVSVFRKTETALTGFYDKPMQRSFVVPDECKAEESFLGCVADGKVTGSAMWSVDKDHAATLTIVARPLPASSTLRVRVGRPRANP